MKKERWLKIIRDASIRRFGTRVKKLYPVGAIYERLTVKGHIRLDNGCWAVICSCTCGREKTVKYPNQMRRGLVNSCGCLNRELASARWRGKPAIGMLVKGEAAFNALLRAYRRNALIRGLEFRLTREQFRVLTQHDCAYCGQSPAQVCGKRTADKRYNGIFVYNGVDRIEPELGYTSSNTVSCCVQCNRAKRNLSHGAFIEWIQRLVKKNAAQVFRSFVARKMRVLRQDVSNSGCAGLPAPVRARRP